MSALRGLVAAATLLALAPGPVRAGTSAPSCAALDTLLARHLHEGQVDYGALARDRGPLERFLASTREVRPDTWPEADQIAFWVNVYNARVLEGVVRRPGLKSVLDVGRFLGVPTLGFFRDKARSGGRDLSLDDIEHRILCKRFREPRVHFVLNCASASCPVLPSRALEAATLEATLEAATRAFLADTARNRVAPDATLELSSLFKWYRADFEAASGSLPAFIAEHAPSARPIDASARIRFLDYDWALNGHW